MQEEAIMKRVLALLLVAAGAIGVTSVVKVHAADQPVRSDKSAEQLKPEPGEEKMMPEPEVQLKRLSKGLQLTEDQQKQIKPILDDEYARLKEIRKSEEISPQQIQKKVEESRTGTIAKIKECLTPEQQEKYTKVSKEIKASKQKRMKENRKARIGTQPDPVEQSRQ